MAGKIFYCKGNHPCKICGKPDWCSYVLFPNGDELPYCKRVHASKGESVQGMDGRLYVWKKETDEGFHVYEEVSQYERNREEFLRAKGLSGKKSGYTLKDTDYVSEENMYVEGVAECLPPEKLDRFYRTFLSLLTIEDKHVKKLKDEWGSQPGLYESIVKTWGIRSVPPEDFVRFSSSEKLKNESRKKIMAKLIEKCGEPKGVPGFYQKKDGSWTFYKLCGIAFPIYNTKGQIIRLRINDDYPDVLADFNGVEGKFSYEARRDANDNSTAGWYFIPMREGRYRYDDATLVWAYNWKYNRIKLTKKGYPSGKVQGKYKNFSSYREKRYEENGSLKAVNVFNNGCQSGSYCSLYYSKGDNFSVVYATEGEKKAMVANKLLHIPVVSIPGVSSFKKLFEKEDASASSIMQVLKKNGLSLMVLVYDADKGENLAVLKTEERAVQTFIANGVNIAIGEWDANWGKGLDDVLLTGVVPQVYPIGA